ncbi:hypothetical protein EJ02DRAFT_456048 [Clathrospora elynae]|uniref:Uncharacterized protein n=1 Tax=Clathrospora elynae TaxID=706981 RepID=A0A6A5SJV5_9PLEO|nr:hypothetical protein EJ02DRAFT_456048 [Clathrospora elynae]
MQPRLHPANLAIQVRAALSLALALALTVNMALCRAVGDEDIRHLRHRIRPYIAVGCPPWCCMAPHGAA